jgi:hypothetical protein
MRKITKIATASALVLGALFVAPAAANAAYTPASSVTVSGPVAPGGTDTVSIAAGSFTPGESVTFSVTGAGKATLAALAQQTVSITKDATSTGAASVKVTLPVGGSGTYSLTATGATSGNVATAALTVVPADSGASASDPSGSLAFTGSTVSMLVVWSAAGAIALGIAFMIVLALVRRQRNAI